MAFKKFGRKNKNYNLDAQIMAEKLGYRLADGISFRTGINWIIRAVMNSGANAIEIIINRNVMNYSIPPNTHKVFRCGIMNPKKIRKGIVKYQKGSDIIWIIVKIEIDKNTKVIQHADYYFQENEESLSKKDTRFLKKLKKIKLCEKSVKKFIIN